MTTEPEPLPGLELVDADRRHVTDLEDAVRRTIREHATRGNLSELDAGKVAIALELCQVAAKKRAGGRMSTVSNDLRLLAEILESLTPTASSEVDERLKAAMDAWSEEVSNSGDPGTQVRDPA